MIRIEYQNLNKLVNNHFNAIKNYFHRAGAREYTQTLYSKIDSYLVSNFKGHTFEYLIKAIQLEEMRKEFDTNKPILIPEIDYIPKLYDYFSSYQGNINQALIDVENQDQYTAHALIEKLGIKVCPYCNRNYIFNVPHTKRRTSDMDHFYPKSKYKFFAISFFNLIPSCKVCNFLKNKSEEEIINPYREDYKFDEEIQFYIKPIYINNFINNIDYFDIKLNFSKVSKFKLEYENMIDVFKIEKLYQAHKDVVTEIIRKVEIFTESYIEELLKTKIFSSREEIINLVLNTEVFDTNYRNLRPLTKLTNDINSQYGFNR